MSRGLGREQRRVLGMLEAAAQAHEGAWVLLQSLAGNDPAWDDQGRVKVNESRRESARRAVRTLADKGLVEKRSANYGGVQHWVVRRHQASPRPDLPRSIDNEISFHLRLMDQIHNDVLREYGSRYRKVTIQRPHMEEAHVWDLDDPDRPLQVVYLYPAETTDDENWLSRQAELVAQADLEAEAAVEKEIQRRVALELSRRECTPGCQCGAGPKEPSLRSDAPLTNHELYLGVARLAGLSIGKLLTNATKDLQARTRQQS